MTTHSKRRFSLPDRLFQYLDKRSLIEKIILGLVATVFFISTVYSILELNNKYLVEVPKNGGELNIGVVGAPRFVNPVLAITKADHDLVELTYSGLMKLDNDGELMNDLAERVTVSDDGITYNIELKDNQYFHDGTKVKASDVAFTIKLIQEPELKSPLRGNWTGVRVEVLGDHELNLVLDTAYTPFIENLTVGILPEHLWSDLRVEELPFSQYNTEPIGSGPYEVTSITRNDSGLIDSYELTPANESDTYIRNIEFHFFTTESALMEKLEDGMIDSTASLSYQNVLTLNPFVFDVVKYPLPRTFTLFMNPNRSVAVREPEVREALSLVIDREALIEDVLEGFGYPADSPIPPGFLELEPNNQDDTEEEESGDPIETATLLLEDAGWIKNDSGNWQKEIDEATTTLELRIATSNNELFTRVAEYLATSWKQLGIETRIEQYDQTDLVQSVIRPRDYQTLLFGADVGRSLDLYPFWHSSQREDPGLNVALYTNITTDALLETLRTTRDDKEAKNTLLEIESEIKSETAAIFLFSPALVNVYKNNIHVEPVNKITKASDRLSSIDKWYVIQDKLWKIFVK